MNLACSRSVVFGVAMIAVLHPGHAAIAEDAESLPAGAKLVSIEAVPSSIQLVHKYDYVQVLLTGRLASGDSFDVTRLAKPAADSKLVKISPTGLIRPLADGQGEVVFTLAGKQVNVPVDVTGYDAEFDVDYIRDVMPVMSKMGCNSGTCHGSKEGKNGFKLSLRGYDPIFDTRALADDLAARRINRASPENSLMLLKSTGSVPHVGGQLTKPGEPYYEIVRAWIANGLKLDLSTPRVTKIQITPINPIIQREGMRQQMRVLATYADGMVRDVTAEAFIETGNQDVALTDDAGLATALRRGEAPLLARFEGAYDATTVTVMGDRTGFVWQPPAKNSKIDELVAAKLKRIKTLSSPLCTDAEFIRRLYFDLTGLPPTPSDVRAFLADSRPANVKRNELIDELVGGREFVEHWTNKWADLLQVNRKFLGQEGSAAFRNWIKQAVASNMPYDEFVYTVLTASGSNRQNPAASYFKVLRTPAETMENTTHLFLAVRFNCNKCHDHPFERWTQDQYYQMAAYFAQIGLKTDPASGNRKIAGTAVEGAKPLFEVVYDKNAGDVTHERTGAVTPPEFPYQHEFESDGQASRREQLARWITSKNNRYFAASYVNRIWGYLLGVGIIEPLDDIRAGNPPTNPELLDWLTQQFVESGFDVRDLMRAICKSRTYQLSVETNKWNEDDKTNYSHAMARRLPAEVLYDAVHRVTGSTQRLPGLPEGMRAAQLPDAGVKLPSGFLAQLGRPARESSCECERTSGLMLGPVMALINGPTIANAIADPNNALVRLVAETKEDKNLVAEIFMRILNRAPTETEVAAGLESLAAVEADHLKLVAELNAYEKTMAGRIAAWKQQQEAKLRKATAALAAYEKTLPVKLAAWEKRQSEAEWTVLDAVKLTATNGATLTKEDSVELLAKGENGSIFVTGKNGKGAYQVEAETSLAGITGIRLELFADARLPKSGPGRAQNGNFVLSEFTLTTADKAKPDEAKPVVLQNAQADFSQQNYDVSRAIDGNAGTGWASSPRLGQKRLALFETQQDVGAPGGSVLRFKLDQQYDDTHTIGRFRISVTTAPRPLSLSGPPAAIVTILETPADKRNDTQQAELLKHYRTIDAQLKKLELAAAAAQSPMPPDAKLAQLQQTVQTSKEQLANKRLIGAQDLAWALINSPAFLFNR